MAAALTGPFARELENNRSRFNAKFAEARWERPRLDPAAFRNVLAVVVAPVVEAVDAVAPDRAALAAEALYDLALDLTGQDLLGPAARSAAVAAGWAALLPRLGRFLAEAPRSVAGAVTNALYNLASTPGARPEEWMGRMLALADHCPDAETLLTAGQVAAWRAGMAHYRAGALDLCRTLPPPIARVALGLPAESEPPDSVIDALAADPWLAPDRFGHSSPLPRSLSIVARAGAFRGFGGLFLRPPIVACAGEHFLVSDGEDSWLLVADACGATFHRMSGVPTTSAPSPFMLGRDGAVKAADRGVKFAELAEPTSHAGNATTLAVTTALSHAVFLVAIA